MFRRPQGQKLGCRRTPNTPSSRRSRPLPVQLSDVSLVTPPHQIQEDGVLVHAAPVHVARPQNRIAHSRIADVMLRLRAQVPLPLDIVVFCLIEGEGVAEAGDAAPNGDVVGGNPVGIEDVGDVVGRAEVAGIRTFCSTAEKSSFFLAAASETAQSKSSRVTKSGRRMHDMKLKSSFRA